MLPMLTITELPVFWRGLHLQGQAVWEDTFLWNVSIYESN